MLTEIYFVEKVGSETLRYMGKFKVSAFILDSQFSSCLNKMQNPVVFVQEKSPMESQKCSLV